MVGGDSQAVISNLIGAAKPVHGAWGSGTLLTTSLFSMLMTNGEVYIGAVEPSVLYAAVGHASCSIDASMAEDRHGTRSWRSPAPG